MCRKYSLKRNAHYTGGNTRLSEIKAYSVLSEQILPKSVDLRQNMPPIYDQGNLGSCTANAIASVIQYEHIKNHLNSHIPSRLFIYYNERDLEGLSEYDVGARIIDGLRAVELFGVCPETVWEYKEDNFDDKPSQECYKQGLMETVTEYSYVHQRLNDLKSALANGYPIIFGMAVYDSFESEVVANTGIATTPTPNDIYLGDHAVVAVGYDDENKIFIIRNSWGKNWGQDGYFTLPYEFLSDPNLSFDFWIVKSLSHQSELMA